ncbi:MAG: hypothetical protein QGH13_00530 [Candidatus Thalassarchaeaceae archaeon]|jgi:outer membrane protein assembly factor BamB|nr:hypothetical protein [Candidatus Thalassarchaeaceae archaeon]|tara:strand:+ start:985 stop:2592 length:1608 start_codon:yes stop_codon:yes gene_type:complete
MRSEAAWLVVSIIAILIIAMAPEPVLDSKERFFPDIPVPPSPPCPEGTECALTHICEPSEPYISPNLTELWNANGSFRIFSSPNLVDLNNDGVLDIVNGMGIEEQEIGAVIALDGVNGSPLWQANTNAELFATAQFKDLNKDGQEDVILGGRSHQLLAIDGITGEKIWTFDDANQGNDLSTSEWFQFYTGQFIPDRNGDGVDDWLTSNGGDPSKGPGESRSNGFMMIISGATGEILSYASTPDDKETYMSPIVFQPHPEMETEVLFGTGGETFSGSLWSTSIQDIEAGDISNSIMLTQSKEGVEKGVMAPPVIVDITHDGILDIVAPTFDGRVIAIDGRNHTIVWTIEVSEHAFDGNSVDIESYASPAIGYFTDDAIPDIFVHFVIGTFPDYSASTSLMIDGNSGEVLWKNDSTHSGFTSPLAADMNGDGRDEIIMIRSGGEMFENNGVMPFYHDIEILDSCSMTHVLLAHREGMSIGTPTLSDIDGDGVLELITTDTTGYSGPSCSIILWSLGVDAPTSISWSSYLGTNNDGIF